MKILIVIDQFDNSNNGTTISARRFAKGLQEAGNEVYVVSTGDKKDEYKFNLKELPLPPGISHKNITYTIGLGTKTKVNDLIYTHYRDSFFNHFTHIHCPSEFIANELKKHGYTAKIQCVKNYVNKLCNWGQFPIAQLKHYGFPIFL